MCLGKANKVTIAIRIKRLIMHCTVKNSLILCRYESKVRNLSSACYLNTRAIVTAKIMQKFDGIRNIKLNMSEYGEYNS